MKSRKLTHKFGLILAATLALASWTQAGTNVILHLRNGDRIAGAILREDTNHVVVATSWANALPVPQSAIERRELPNETAVIAGHPSPASTNGTAAPGLASAVVPPPPQPKAPRPWKVNVMFGTSLVFGAKDSESYYGRMKLTYDQPYEGDSKKFFRSLLDYSVDYGETDDVQSANRMGGGLKTDFDIGTELYVYSLASAGYDLVRKIEFQYAVGPGLGYHLVTRPQLGLNTEAGFDYQYQRREDAPDTSCFYARLAQNANWKIVERVTFTESFAYMPQFEEVSQFRLRLDATLAFNLWQNLTLNLSAFDVYDTNPAPGVDPNELQFRSALGLTF